jgi:hypothetical protein
MMQAWSNYLDKLRVEAAGEAAQAVGFEGRMKGGRESAAMD